jgi:hypothetical protein
MNRILSDLPKSIRFIQADPVHPRESRSEPVLVRAVPLPYTSSSPPRDDEEATLRMARLESPIDQPITEEDAAALYLFYSEFLRKDPNDALSLLKCVTLLRRNELREYVHNFGTLRKRLDTMLRGARQRDLLLSYPSTIHRVHDLLWEGQEAYGEDGSTVMTILGSQASDYLDQTESFRVDLDSLLADCPSMVAGDAEALARLANESHGAFLYTLIALADHVFVALLPHDHPEPTEAVLRTRNYVQERLGPKFEDQIIEFFVVGGGFIRATSHGLVLGGAHPLFDPTFADLGQDGSNRLLADFVYKKHRLTIDALRIELPDLQFLVQV